MFSLTFLVTVLWHINIMVMNFGLFDSYLFLDNDWVCISNAHSTNFPHARVIKSNCVKMLF
jgi:hypothetical protein